jgi:PfaD family protein
MPDGRIVCPNHVIAKVSREGVARKFFAPPPDKILAELVRQNKISPTEADLARRIPLAQDMTAEADSGGHTDNRPALSLFPTFQALRDQAVQRFGYKIPLRVGLGGGIATPEAAAAAFAMGAAYVLTGSVNQSCVEADTSEVVRAMLAQAQQADVIMAPAADMFELGAKVQVLKRGTMFAMRATKLYELYRTYPSYEEIPDRDRRFVEHDLLQKSFEQAWQETRAYFESRNPNQIARAQKEAKHKMALVFRSYLGQASLWAKKGLAERQIDFQIWCGPAMGAFNAWVKNSFLENPENRRIDIVALNLLYGAAGLIRCHYLRSQGVFLPQGVTEFRPLTAEDISRKVRF